MKENQISNYPPDRMMESNVAMLKSIADCMGKAYKSLKKNSNEATSVFFVSICAKLVGDLIIGYKTIGSVDSTLPPWKELLSSLEENLSIIERSK